MKRLFLVIISFLLFILALEFFSFFGKSDQPSVPGDLLFTDYPQKQNCVPTNEQCLNIDDGSNCTIGVWCDEEGKICGGQECANLSEGRCIGQTCLSLCSYCPSYVKPPDSLCEGGKVLEGEPVYNEEENCYCLGPRQCVLF